MMRIFISSVQKEFERERAELGEFIAGDALLRRQFTTFIFERDIPAEDRRADDVYLDELSTCDLYLARYVERYGTGTGDMIQRCREAGLPEPDFQLTDGFVTILRRPVRAQAEAPSPSNRHQVGTRSALSPHQVEILHKSLTPCELIKLIALSGRTDRTKFRNQVIRPLLEAEYLEMTLPDRPTSSRQQYQTTAKGRQLLERLKKNGEQL